MATIEKEQVITSYHGRLYSRVFEYMRPYVKKFAVALVLVLIVSAISLYEPMLIARAIDTYIGGYKDLLQVIHYVLIHFHLCKNGIVDPGAQISEKAFFLFKYAHVSP